MERGGVAVPYGIGEVGEFGWGVFHERHPELVRRVCREVPYGVGQRERLVALVEESCGGDVREPGPGVAEREWWMEWGRPWFGGAWGRVPFLEAESYFYLRLLEAVDYFAPGPWQGVDPFAPMKGAELADPGLERDSAWMGELDGLGAGEAFRVLVLASLFGNRADLGFALSAPEGAEHAAERHPLVSDDMDAVLAHLEARPPGGVHLVLDNAGRELIADLLLADHLLTQRQAREVVLHVKPRPYYVSDATAADVRDCLGRLGGLPGRAPEAAGRLHRAAGEGRLRLLTDPFYCRPLGYRDVAGELRDTLASATLCLFKGDLNYRRLVGGRAWDPARPFADAVAAVPGSLAVLRTLKSDVLVGADPAVVEELDRARPGWRADGSQALVQARLET